MAIIGGINDFMAAWNPYVSLLLTWACEKESDSNSQAGAGKTKLVSRVIDHISNGLCDQALAYFYCNRNEDIRRDPEQVLRSFVKQLSFSQDESVLHNALVKIYKKKKLTGFASGKLTFDESRSLLSVLIQAYSRTVLVLDALDEGERLARVKLIEVFDQLVAKSPHLKILISSRCDDDIKRQLEKRANVGIKATDNADDISKFINEKINQE